MTWAATPSHPMRRSWRPPSETRVQGCGRCAARHTEGRADASRRRLRPLRASRSEEHTSELQSLMRISYAVFCLKKKKRQRRNQDTTTHDTNDRLSKRRIKI